MWWHIGIQADDSDPALNSLSANGTSKDYEYMAEHEDLDEIVKMALSGKCAMWFVGFTGNAEEEVCRFHNKK